MTEKKSSILAPFRQWLGGARPPATTADSPPFLSDAPVIVQGGNTYVAQQGAVAIAMVPNRDNISSFSGFIEAITGGRYNPVPPPTRFSVRDGDRLALEGSENCHYKTAIGQGVNCDFTEPVAKEIRNALRDGLLSSEEASAIVTLVNELPANGLLKHVHSRAGEKLYITAAREEGVLRFAYRRDSEQPGSWQEHSITAQPDGTIRSEQSRVENGVRTERLAGVVEDPDKARNLQAAYQKYQADGTLTRVEALSIMHTVEALENGIPVAPLPTEAKAPQYFAGQGL